MSWNPSRGNLDALRQEGAEHVRAWRIIHGLTKVIDDERAKRRGSATYSPEKHDEHVQRIQDLEAKVIAQKDMLRQLEECRAFERESEALLIKALASAGETLRSQVFRSTSVDRALVTIMAAMETNINRKGPRPTEVA